MTSNASASSRFGDRVEELRDSWEERREVRPLATAFDLESQRRLLTVLHRWTEECAAAVRSVYGSQLDLTVDSLPAEEPHVFSMRLDGMMSLTFALTERRRRSSRLWTISAHLSALQRGFLVSIDSERRNGPWSRARVENLVLSLLGAYERARSTVSLPQTASASPAAG